MNDTTETTSVPAKSPDQVVITDARGRRITIKSVSARQQFHMMKYLGGTNETYIGMAVMAASVQDIDGAPLPSAKDEGTLDVAFNLLGDDGWAAVQAHYASLAPKEESDKVMANAKN